MADPATYRPAPGEIPDQPGVYRFRDEHGRDAYVGKAKSLLPRLNSYFQDAARLPPPTPQMVAAAPSSQWTLGGTEAQARALHSPEHREAVRALAATLSTTNDR